MPDNPVKKATSATAEVAEEAPVETVASKPKRKKSRRNVPIGQVHVLATFNNTIVTVTDTKGNTLTTASAGSTGFRGYQLEQNQD